MVWLQFFLSVTALALAGAASILAGRAAQGFCTRFQAGAFEPLLTALFLLFLVVVGFKALDWAAARGWKQVDVLPLPPRAGWPAEWGTGAAVGWGLSLAVVIPVLVSFHFHSHFAFSRVSVSALVLALSSLLVGTLAQEAIFRGYPFARLVEAVGPSWAAVLMSCGFAVTLLSATPPRHVLFALADGFFFGLLLALAYLRTHALWVGWGLHFSYRAIGAVMLGLPVAGRGEFGSVLDSYVTGPRWLSGGAFGLDAALMTSIFMLAALAVLYRVTRDYAWRYTQREIVGAGYEVTIAPPAAHAAMETKAAAAAPLVQILGSTSQSRSRVAEGQADPFDLHPPPTS